MKTIEELKSALTEKEFTMLELIVSCYHMLDNICYDDELSPSEKGVVGSLVKKGFIYDSFVDMHHEDGHEKSNFFPATIILDIYGLEHY